MMEEGKMLQAVMTKSGIIEFNEIPIPKVGSKTAHNR